VPAASLDNSFVSVISASVQPASLRLWAWHSEIRAKSWRAGIVIHCRRAAVLRWAIICFGVAIFVSALGYAWMAKGAVAVGKFLVIVFAVSMAGTIVILLVRRWLPGMPVREPKTPVYRAPGTSERHVSGPEDVANGNTAGGSLHRVQAESGSGKGGSHASQSK